MLKTPLERKLTRLQKQKHFLKLSDLEYDNDPLENSMLEAMEWYMRDFAKPYGALCEKSKSYYKNFTSEDNIVLVSVHALFGTDSNKALSDTTLQEKSRESFKSRFPERKLKKYTIARYEPVVDLVDFVVSQGEKEDQTLLTIKVRVELKKPYVRKSVWWYNPPKPFKSVVTRKEYMKMDSLEVYEFVMKGGQIVEDGTCERCGGMHDVSACPIVIEERRLESILCEKERRERQTLQIREDRAYVAKLYPPKRRVVNMKEIREFLRDVYYFKVSYGFEDEVLDRFFGRLSKEETLNFIANNGAFRSISYVKKPEKAVDLFWTLNDWGVFSIVESVKRRTETYCYKKEQIFEEEGSWLRNRATTGKLLVDELRLCEIFDEALCLEPGTALSSITREVLTIEIKY